MTYASSTLGSTSTNPPAQLVNFLSAGQASGLGMAPKGIWLYSSTHTGSEMTAAAFITDAKALGMTAGDIFFGVTASAGSTTPIAYWGPIANVSTAGANLSTNYATSTAA